MRPFPEARVIKVYIDLFVKNISVVLDDSRATSQTIHVVSNQSPFSPLWSKLKNLINKINVIGQIKLYNINTIL